MTVRGWLQIGVFSVVVLLLTKPVGLWLYRVFESRARPLPRRKPPLPGSAASAAPPGRAPIKKGKNR